jgi:hypothetical protein
MMAPNGSIVVPSQLRISETRRPGRQQGRHHGRARHNDDGAQHDRGFVRQAEQWTGQQRGTGPRDRDTQVEQATDDTLVVALQFAELEVESTVEQDDRHGKCNERRERRAQTLGGVHCTDVMARDEPHRQQQDDGRYAHALGHDLAAHSEQHRQAEADEDVALGHPATITMRTISGVGFDRG